MEGFCFLWFFLQHYHWEKCDSVFCGLFILQGPELVFKLAAGMHISLQPRAAVHVHCPWPSWVPLEGLSIAYMYWWATGTANVTHYSSAPAVQQRSLFLRAASQP